MEEALQLPQRIAHGIGRQDEIVEQWVRADRCLERHVGRQIQ